MFCEFVINNLKQLVSLNQNLIQTEKLLGTTIFVEQKK